MKPYRPYMQLAYLLTGSSYLRPRSATIASGTTNMCQVTFNRCMILDPFHAGVAYQLNGGVWQDVGESFQDSDTVCRFSMSSPQPVEGDVIRWRYTPGVASAGGIGITDCEEPPVEMGAAEIGVFNPIDTTAPFITAAEVGIEGANIVGVTLSEPVQTDNRVEGWSVTSTNGPNTVTHVNSEFPSKIYLVLGTPIEVGETVFLEYEGSPVGDVTDMSEWPSPNDLEEELMFPVVNNAVDTGVDTEPPLVFEFVANGGSSDIYEAEVSIDTFVASDNVTAAEDLMYQVKVSPPYPLTTPPPVDDPNWLTFANRLTPVTLPGQGSYTLTAYVMDEAGNVSRGLIDAQEPVTAVMTAFEALGYDPITFELDGVQKGIGGLTNARVAVINVLDNDRIYRPIPTATVAYPGSRIVMNKAQYSENLTLWTKAGSVSTPDADTFQFNGETTTNDDRILGLWDSIPQASAESIYPITDLTLSADWDVYGYSVTTVAGVRYKFRFEAKAGTASTIRVNFYVALNGVGYIQFYGKSGQPAVSTAHIRKVQAEWGLASTNTAPSEYCGPTGSSAFLVTRQFANANGNSLVGKLLTEAVGAPLDPQPYALSASAATNIVKQSSNLANTTSWDAAFAKGTASTATSPKGDTSAFLITAKAGATYGGLMRQTQSYLPLGSTKYAMWCWAKQGTHRYFGMRPSASIYQQSPGANYCYFDLQTGIATPITPEAGSIDDIGMEDVGNGWWLCWVVATTQETPIASNPDYALVTSSGSSYLYATGSETIYLWQPQLDKSAVAFSYISTTTAAVTRDKDVISADTGNLLDPQGSLYCEIKPTTGTGNVVGTFLKLVNNFAVIDDGTNTTSSAALVDNNVSSKLGMVWSPAGMQVCANGTWSPLVPYDSTLLSGALDIFRDGTSPMEMLDWQTWPVASVGAIDALMGA